MVLLNKRWLATLKTCKFVLTPLQNQQRPFASISPCLTLASTAHLTATALESLSLNRDLCQELVVVPLCKQRSPLALSLLLPASVPIQPWHLLMPYHDESKTELYLHHANLHIADKFPLPIVPPLFVD